MGKELKELETAVREFVAVFISTTKLDRVVEWLLEPHPLNRVVLGVLVTAVTIYVGTSIVLTVVELGG